MKHLYITLIMMLVTSMANAQCPDSNHPHAIDLGLPSGTKWACCNVGATTPEGFGNYYAWGETKEKEKYDWASYIHCDGTMETCHDIGSDIAGTEYDAAHVVWGGSWVMPSQEQFKELIDKCSYTYVTKNGVDGGLFTGPNGCTIFLPDAFFRWNEFLECATLGSNYWSSTKYASNSSYCLNFDNCGGTWRHSEARGFGLTVRPVTSGAVEQPVRGDIDGDGVVSIKDVMEVIDIILTGKE